MPSASDYDQLGSIFLSIKNVKWGAEKLFADFGSGYYADALVGASRGLHKWKITLRPLSDSATPNAVGGQPPFTYVYEFFKTHTVTETPFILAWNGKTWTVRFSDPDMDFERFKDGIYQTGIDVQQVTIRGFTSYNSDGSIAP